MNIRRPNYPRGYTLIEVMLAMAIFSLVMLAIYSTWFGIMKASRVGQDAAIAAQRERTAMHVIEEALSGAQLFVANPNYYSFAPKTEGKTTLSFVASLPADFPRSGKFSGWPMRRVTFSLETGGNGQKQLLLRQNPILMELSDDEKIKPVVLARNVKLFKMQFWDDQDHEFKDEWIETNQLPKMVEVTLQLNYTGSHSVTTEPKLVALVGLPTTGVPPNWQAPQAGGPP
jgi:prepilin-type N-terminal cleavage/methylation domain-containing protein